MKTRLTHHQFYSICNAVAAIGEQASIMPTKDIIGHVAAATGVSISPSHVASVFEALDMPRLTDPTILEFAVRGLMAKLGFGFTELVNEGKKIVERQAAARTKLEESSPPLPLDTPGYVGESDNSPSGKELEP